VILLRPFGGIDFRGVMIFHDVSIVRDDTI